MTLAKIKSIAEDYKKELECKSGLPHIKETRVWQKKAVDELVERIQREYETKWQGY